MTRPSNALLAEMLEFAEWEIARGHLLAMRNLHYHEWDASEGSAEAKRGQRWLEMSDVMDEFIKYMDSYVS